MKFNIKKIIAASTLVIALASCKKELDLKPSDYFTEDKAYLTVEDVQAGVTAAYARMGAYTSNIYASALLSDEARLGAGNAGQGALTYRYQTNSGDGAITGAFGAFYSVIHQVNTVLRYVDNVSGDASLKADLKGQLLGLRAVCHYYILESYSGRYNASGVGVPFCTTTDIFALLGRGTMGETLSKIEADLTAAQSLLAATTSTNFSDRIFNKINLTAFQAKIALYKGDYDAAINYATTVINSGIKPIVSGTAYSGIWTDVNQNEILFRVIYPTSTVMGGMWSTLAGDSYIAPSDKLTNAYTTGDNRKAIFIGTVGGNRIVKKYYTSSRGGLVVDMKMIRTAEMYLIRAEAYAKATTPNITAGANDLFELRKKRFTPVPTVAPTFASSGDLLTAVLDERFKELCFEGTRFFDLKRNYLPVARLASDAGSSWLGLDKDNFRFLLPIPAEEIQANPKMTQNPGYN